jgi:hypothetical protein
MGHSGDGDVAKVLQSEDKACFRADGLNARGAGGDGLIAPHPTTYHKDPLATTDFRSIDTFSPAIRNFTAPQTKERQQLSNIQQHSPFLAPWFSLQGAIFSSRSDVLGALFRVLKRILGLLP